MRAMVLTMLAMVGCLVASVAETQAAGETPRLSRGRVEIYVSDLHCATCAKKVARKLYGVKGVRKVQTSVKHNLLVVQLPPKQAVPVAALWSAVAASETPPVELRYADQRLDAEQVKPLLTALKAAAVRR